MSKPLQPCGTRAAWRRHHAANETPCHPCVMANRAHNTMMRRKKGVPIKATTEDLVEEITWLLKAGEGEHRILAATGYTGRAHSLRDRLTRNGHAQLGDRIFNGWELAA